jgi:hypothetical protein
MTYGPQLLDWLYGFARSKFSKDRNVKSHRSPEYGYVVDPRSYKVKFCFDGLHIRYLQTVFAPEFFQSLTPDGFLDTLNFINKVKSYSVTTATDNDYVAYTYGDNAFCGTLSTDHSIASSSPLGTVNFATGLASAYVYEAGSMNANRSNVDQMRFGAKVYEFTATEPLLSRKGALHFTWYGSLVNNSLQGALPALSITERINAPFYSLTPLAGLTGKNPSVRFVTPPDSITKLGLLRADSVNADFVADSDVFSLAIEAGNPSTPVGTLFVTDNFDYTCAPALNGIVKMMMTPIGFATLMCASDLIKAYPWILSLSRDDAESLCTHLAELEPTYSGVMNGVSQHKDFEDWVANHKTNVNIAKQYAMTVKSVVNEEQPSFELEAY